jgi:hypothetical protein
MSPSRKATVPPRRLAGRGAFAGFCLALACGGSSASTLDSSDGSGGSSGGGSSSSGSSSGTTSSSSGGSSSSGSSSSGSSSGSGGSSSGSSSGSGGGSSSGGVPEGGPLDPSVPPSGNFDLSVWELQEPVGSSGSPTVISPGKLANGFHDSYFFTDPTDGAMTFWDPENGVTTGGSDFPRSELREMTKAALAASWSSGTNTLSATLAVPAVPDHVCVGQIHTSGTKPLLELYFYASGGLVLGIEQTPAGGNEIPHPVGHVPLGTEWSYVITLANGTISLAIDGGAPLTFSLPSAFAGQSYYFKAGDYDQSAGSSATVGATVKFYALAVHHGP